MFDRILVPLDGSKKSETAVLAAETLSRKFAATPTGAARGEIILLYVNEPHAPRRIHGEHHLQGVSEAESYLEALAVMSRGRGFSVRWHVHESTERDVAFGIALHDREMDPDLIVVSSHGAKGSARLFTGSVAQRIAGASAVPVFMVRSDWKPSETDFLCHGILVPLDGQMPHEAGLPVALKLATLCRAEIHLMLIVPTFNTAEGNVDPIRRFLPGTTMRMLDLEVGAGERYVAAVAEDIQKQGIKITWEVSRGDPSKQIVKATRNTQCDLLILATHGNEGFNAFWTGSVAHRICSYTDTPVLLVPVQRDERGTEPSEA